MKYQVANWCFSSHIREEDHEVATKWFFQIFFIFLVVEKKNIGWPLMHFLPHSGRRHCPMFFSNFLFSFPLKKTSGNCPPNVCLLLTFGKRPLNNYLIFLKYKIRQLNKNIDWLFNVFLSTSGKKIAFSTTSQNLKINIIAFGVNQLYTI